MSNFLDKLKARMQAANEAAMSAIDAAQHLVVPEEIAANRMSICKECDHWFTPTNQCKKCGCFLAAKTKFAGFACPINKWTKYEEKTDAINAITK